MLNKRKYIRSYKKNKKVNAHSVDNIVDRYLEINKQMQEMLTQKEWEALKKEIQNRHK